MSFATSWLFGLQCLRNQFVYCGTGCLPLVWVLRIRPCGDCLTYGPGHYKTWDHWRRDRTVEPALQAIVQSYKYEDWPRGRIVFDRARDLFILYADRKLMTPATIARIKTQSHLPHRSQKRLALPEHRDAGRVRGMIPAVLKDGCEHRAHLDQLCRTSSCESAPSFRTIV